MGVYADNAATTKVSKEVLDAVIPCMRDVYGNPSSLHPVGKEAKKYLEISRNKIATCLNCQPDEIVFTSGGSESDNWAIKSIAYALRKKGKTHIITSRIEHHAVLYTCRELEKDGFRVTYLNVDEKGCIDLVELSKAITDDTALVSIMYANNEIGTIQPVKEIGEICRKHKVYFHTDAVQACGHIDIDVRRDNIDLMSISAHKFHGLKGVGALYIKSSVPISSMIVGGGQEHKLRAGTENVPGIYAMAIALEISCRDMEKNNLYIKGLREQLIKGLSEIPSAYFNGDPVNCLPGTINVSFKGIDSEGMILMLGGYGICASSGSACNSGNIDLSHVLLAIGRNYDIAAGAVRFSINEDNTPSDIDYIIKVTKKLTSFFRGIYVNGLI